MHIFDSSKVTVCPPKNTLTNMNYDIEMLGNKSVNEEARNELNKFIIDEIHDPYFESIMKNLNAFYEENRFYNWYHGFTKIECPYKTFLKINRMKTSVIKMKTDTTTPFGTVSTPYYGNKYNESLYEPIEYYIKIYVPHSLVTDKNFTLFWRESVIDGSNKIKIKERNYTSVNMISYSRIHKFLGGYTSFNQDIKDKKYLMPGLQLQWHYNVDVPFADDYSSDLLTIFYVR